MIDSYNERPSWSSLEVGDAGPALTLPALTREDFVRYAGASGDFSRIHFDEPFAQEAGYDGVFAHGMLLAGFASHLVSGWLGLERVESFGTRFESRAEPGTTVTVRCSVTDKYRERGSRYVAVDLEVVDESDETLVAGSAVVNFDG